MRRNDKKIEEKALIEKILSGNTVCRVALADGTDPYIIPMNYGYHDGNFFLHSANEGKKLDIIKVNNNICIEVSDSIETVTSGTGCNFGTKYRSVICRGTVEILESPDEKAEGLKIIMEQHTGVSEWEFTPSAMEKVTVIKVLTDEITGKISGF